MSVIVLVVPSSPVRDLVTSQSHHGGFVPCGLYGRASSVCGDVCRTKNQKDIRPKFSGGGCDTVNR